VHEGNVKVLVLDDGAIRFVTPDGHSFDSTLQDHTHPLHADWHQLVAANEQENLHIDHQTAATGWDGLPSDLGFAVESLIRKWQRAPHVTSQ
jgi:hypothetical protein